MKINKKKIILSLIFILLVTGMLIVQGPRLTKPLHVRLVSNNNDQRYLAYFSLQKLKQKDRVALIPFLAEHLRNQDLDRSRRFALYCMRIIGDTNREVVQSVLDALGDPSSLVVSEAITAVSWLGPAITPEILPGLHQYDKGIRKELINSIARRKEKVLSQLIDGIKQPVSETRVNAAHVIAKMGEPAKAALPDLLGGLNDPADRVKEAFAIAVNSINPEETRTIPVLTGLITGKEWGGMQYRAVEALAALGKKARSAVPALEEALKTGADGYTDTPWPKPVLADALHRIKPRPTSLQAIKWDLKHKNFWTRYRAAWFVGEMDPPNTIYLPPLVKSLDEPVPGVFARVVYGLGQIGIEKADRFHEKIIPALMKSLSDKNLSGKLEGYPEMAAGVLAQMGSQTIRFVMDNLQKGVITVDHADLVFSKLERHALSSLSAYQDYGDPNVRLAATRGLERLAASEEVTQESDQ